MSSAAACSACARGEIRTRTAGGAPRHDPSGEICTASAPGAALKTSIGERLPLWPYGPADHHETCCRLHAAGGVGFCDCKASDASDVDWGHGA